MRRRRCACHASCFLELGCWQDCADACSAVLISDPGNGKAFFWRGQAFSILGQHADAVNDLQHALRLSDWAEEGRIKATLLEAEQTGAGALLHLAAETGDVERIRVRTELRGEKWGRGHLSNSLSASP